MIYIVSLQYSPIFKSHSFALGKQLKKKGYEIKYLLSSQYEWMLNSKELEDVLFIGQSNDIKTIFFDSINYNNIKLIKSYIDKDHPEYVYLQNIHPIFNYYIAKYVKKKGGKVIQHIHEPYVENKSVYGGFQRYWLYLFEFIQGLVLDKTDIIVLSSIEAFNLFNKRYFKFNKKKLIIPLMYEDLCSNYGNESQKRSIINFIGPPVPAKSPETFLKIVKQSIDDNFLLISRLKVEDKRYNYPNLKIYYDKNISDLEMVRFMKKSLMTITPYKTARQSSVAATAYMSGTPVLGSNINGLNECVDHKKTGYLVNLDDDINHWLDGIEFIKKNINHLSKNCRKCFVDRYSEKNWPKYFVEVFD